MVVNYSKWDALELSDDSDIEVHPNVDKRSFIRAKQNQIHQQRFERRHQIETLKYERIINDGLLQRIDRLLGSLREQTQKGTGVEDQGPEDFMMQALMDCTGTMVEDEPPKPPEGVHTQTEQPKYSVMMASLVDQVKKDAGKEADGQDWLNVYTKGVKGHQNKVQTLQAELEQKLAELEKEEGKKITSDSIHTGFSMSSVSKEKEKPKSTSTAAKKEKVEVLNPGALNRLDSAGQSSGAEADVDEPVKNIANAGEDDDEEHIEPSELGKKFAKIPMGDYKKCLEFISQNHDVVAERETDGLLIEAFNAQMDGKSDYAKQCVHQALLLQYCRSLGRDGVGLFFKRITTPGHNARTIFHDDVSQTYNRIRTRCAELKKEKASNPSTAEGGVEQIQLHAVDPGTEIHISVPPPLPSEEQEIDPAHRQSREIFESFPPGLQRALESGSLEKVNEVLGKMSVEEAEEVVEKLGQGGMLSVEEGVIDGTTEEGREKLKGLEEKARAEKEEMERAKIAEGKVGEVEVEDVD